MVAFWRMHFVLTALNCFDDEYYDLNQSTSLYLVFHGLLGNVIDFVV